MVVRDFHNFVARTAGSTALQAAEKRAEATSEAQEDVSPDSIYPKE